MWWIDKDELEPVVDAMEYVVNEIRSAAFTDRDSENVIINLWYHNESIHIVCDFLTDMREYYETQAQQQADLDANPLLVCKHSRKLPPERPHTQEYLQGFHDGVRLVGRNAEAMSDE